MTAAATMLTLIVEDQPDTRAWLEGVVRAAFPATETVCLSDRSSAIGWIQAAAPATRTRVRLVLIDLVLPDGRGLDLIGYVRDALPEALPVVVTAFDDDSNLLEAMAQGADGFLLKHHDADMLARCLRRIEDGEPPLTPSIARRILAHFQARAPCATPPSSIAGEAASLTPRETEVLGLLGRGSRVAEVAACLGLTEQTVATYVKIIYRKLRISSRAEAALEAARRGLV